MSRGPEREAKSLEYEWRSITVSPVPWPFKVTAFNRLKGRISCSEMQRAGFNPRSATDTRASFNMDMAFKQRTEIYFMSECVFLDS